MHWLIDVLKVGAGGIGGLLAGGWLAARHAHRSRLLQCYAEYFGQVLSLALAAAPEEVQASLSRLWRTSRELELLESDRACIHATGVLFGRCHDFASIFTDGIGGTSSLLRLRTEISENYAATLHVVRQRLGSARGAF